MNDDLDLLWLLEDMIQQFSLICNNIFIIEIKVYQCAQIAIQLSIHVSSAFRIVFQRTDNVIVTKDTIK